jgi:hypothetical protein
MSGVNAWRAAILASVLAGPVAAQSAGSELPPVIRPSDAGMSCQQMAEEAAQLSAGMGGSSEGQGVLGSLGAVARSGAALLIPGAGLALAGADLATKEGRERRQAEQEAAENRWHYLNGLYAGKGCDAARAAPAQPSAPQSPATQTPAPTAPPSPEITVSAF